MYTHTLFKFAALSKDQAGFPNETFFLQLCVHGKIIESAFPATTKIYFHLLTFFLIFLFFPVFLI